MTQITNLIVCTLTYLIVIVINYLASANLIGKMSVGGISDKYLTAITPASYAFSIWGVIYVLLALFLCYLWYGLITNRNRDLINACGLYFTLSNIANILWIIAWVNDQIAISLIIIVLLFISLYKLVLKVTMSGYRLSFRFILFVRLPTGIYLGWITLATILNISVFLRSVNYANTNTWSSWVSGAVLLIIGIIFYYYLICQKKMYETSIAGIWGFIAIILSENGNVLITIIAILGSVILLLNALYCSRILVKYRNYFQKT